MTASEERLLAYLASIAGDPRVAAARGPESYARAFAARLAADLPGVGRVVLRQFAGRAQVVTEEAVARFVSTAERAVTDAVRGVFSGILGGLGR